MHKLLHVPEQDNPTVSMLSPQAARMLQTAPLLAIGTLDADGQPWTTIWGGEPGFSQPLGSSIIGVKLPVDRKNDPVVQALIGDKADGEVARAEGKGKMVGGLAIDLETRKRVKIYGRMVAGAVGVRSASDNVEEDGPKEEEAQMQLVVRVEQSLGNCPKYLNCKAITPGDIRAKLISSSASLGTEAVALIERADLFFISTSNSSYDMDTNHRGGPPGFVRLFSHSPSSTELVWPEYSGNRLYQTLGNLQISPRAGLVFPDFQTGDVLYVTGTTETLVGQKAAAVLPRSNLAVKLTIAAARYVRGGLGFRGTNGQLSPYNPHIRYASTESKHAASISVERDTRQSATLLSQTPITPTISRFRFSLSNPAQQQPWKPGQWIALDFSEELDIGYSHMRDDDPRSLNDDFVRTFTISSHPPTDRQDDTFEITARRIEGGPVTAWLFRQRRQGAEIPVVAFGGDFSVKEEDRQLGGAVNFVAGGVGITPLLATLPTLDPRNVRLWWTLRADDLSLVEETLQKWPALASNTHIFVTGQKQVAETDDFLSRLKDSGASIEMGRLKRDDLVGSASSHRWYVCANPRLRQEIMLWLEGKEVLFEDFNF